MDEKKHDAKPGVLGPEGWTYHGRGTIRAPESSRKPIEYSYSVVHTQESIRLLDLRIASDDGIALGYLPLIFGAIDKGIVTGAILDEFRNTAFE